MSALNLALVDAKVVFSDAGGHWQWPLANSAALDLDEVIEEVMLAQGYLAAGKISQSPLQPWLPSGDLVMLSVARQPDLDHDGNDADLDKQLFTPATVTQILTPDHLFQYSQKQIAAASQSSIACLLPLPLSPDMQARLNHEACFTGVSTACLQFSVMSMPQALSTQQPFYAKWIAQPKAAALQGAASFEGKGGKAWLSALLALKQRFLKGGYWFNVASSGRAAKVANQLLCQGNVAPSYQSLLDNQHNMALLHAHSDIALMAQLQQMKQAAEGFELQQPTPSSLAQWQQATGCKAVVIWPRLEPNKLQQELTWLINKLGQSSQPFVKTQLGSCYQLPHEPQGVKSCLVYPGVGTCHQNQFQQLPRFFPTVYQSLDEYGELKGLLAHDALTSGEEMTLTELAIAGVGASWLVSHVWQALGLAKDAALGYSMGEVSMWASSGCWKAPQRLAAALSQSEVFTHGITGELSNAQTLWQQDDISWGSYAVRLNCDQFDAVSKQYPRSWLAISHGDNGVLMGDNSQCQSVMAHYQLRGIKIPFVTAMHTPVAHASEQAIAELFTLDTADNAEACLNASQYYASAEYQTVRSQGAEPSVLAQTIAQSIAQGFCQRLDFSRLIKQAYQEGCRYFIEVGPGQACSSHINKILDGKAHFTLPLDSLKRSEQMHYLGVFAALLCHGFKPDTRVLFPYFLHQQDHQ